MEYPTVPDKMTNCPHCNAKEKHLKPVPEGFRCGVCFKTWSAEPEEKPTHVESATVHVESATAAGIDMRNIYAKFSPETYSSKPFTMEDAEKRVIEILNKHMEARHRKALEAYEQEANTWSEEDERAMQAFRVPAGYALELPETIGAVNAAGIRITHIPTNAFYVAFFAQGCRIGYAFYDKDGDKTEEGEV